MAGKTDSLVKPSLAELIIYPFRTLWHWTHSNIHMTWQTLIVLKFMFIQKLGPNVLDKTHGWVTGEMRDGEGAVWSKNIAYASKRKGTGFLAEPEEDRVIVERIGKFLAAMVQKSVTQDEIPQGRKRRMPHAVNYIHGTVQYNGCYAIFNDFKDAMAHLSDRKFVKEMKRFAREENRELTIVLRERKYDPTEYAWFLAFVRAYLPWYANANGPTKKRVLHGTPSPYPAVNPINGVWMRDLQRLYNGERETLLLPPLEQGKYFQGQYQGYRKTYNLVERFHVWVQDLIVRTKGFQGALVFTKREKIEPENLMKYKESGGKWRSGYDVPNPFRN